MKQIFVPPLGELHGKNRPKYANETKTILKHFQNISFQELFQPFCFSLVSDV